MRMYENKFKNTVKPRYRAGVSYHSTGAREQEEEECGERERPAESSVVIAVAARLTELQVVSCLGQEDKRVDQCSFQCFLPF